MAKRAYLDNTYQFAHKATITKISLDPAFVLLSSTIFHPQVRACRLEPGRRVGALSLKPADGQGGGQPTDTGRIVLAGRDTACCFDVSMCRIDREADDVVHEVRE